MRDLVHWLFLDLSHPFEMTAGMLLSVSELFPDVDVCLYIAMDIAVYKPLIQDGNYSKE